MMQLSLKIRLYVLHLQLEANSLEDDVDASVMFDNVLVFDSVAVLQQKLYLSHRTQKSVNCYIPDWQFSH